MFYAQRRGIIFPCRLCCLWSCSLSCCRGNGFCGANSACVIFDKWDAEGKNTCTAPSSLPWAALQHRGEKDGLPVFTVHLIAAAHKQTKKKQCMYVILRKLILNVCYFLLVQLLAQQCLALHCSVSLLLNSLLFFLPPTCCLHPELSCCCQSEKCLPY